MIWRKLEIAPNISLGTKSNLIYAISSKSQFACSEEPRTLQIVETQDVEQIGNDSYLGGRSNTISLLQHETTLN